MYKLNVIAGPNRGTSYVVQEGDLSIGRQMGNSIVLQSSKVSKRHCILEVRGQEVTLKDQGSSNGTFVNGILAKVRQVKTGDRISVGEFVFELIEPPKKSVSKAPAVAGLGQVVQFGDVGTLEQPRNGLDLGTNFSSIGGASSSEIPSDIRGRIIWYFENGIMSYFYGLNLKYEWNLICLFLFSASVLINLIISIYPLIESNRSSIVKEISVRARYLAREIAEQNAPFLASHNETKSEIGRIENEVGVRLALLTALDNRIIAPSSKMNQYLVSGNEAIWANKARKWFSEGHEIGFVQEIDSETIIAIEPVKVMSPTQGKNVIAAMAIVSIDTSLATPDLGEIGVIYSKTFVFSAIIFLTVFIIIYRITLKPFQVLNEDLDKVLQDNLAEVTHDFKLVELNPLWEIINSAVQRISKSSESGEAGANGSADHQQWAQELVESFKVFGAIVNIGIVLFDAEKKIVYFNSIFEEISGIRLESSVGQEMGQVARDQSMGPFTQDLLDRALAGGPGIQDDFDFSGIAYRIHAAAFGALGGSAKGYFLAVVRAEG